MLLDFQKDALNSSSALHLKVVILVEKDRESDALFNLLDSLQATNYGDASNNTHFEIQLWSHTGEDKEANNNSLGKRRHSVQEYFLLEKNQLQSHVEIVDKQYKVSTNSKLEGTSLAQIWEPTSHDERVIIFRVDDTKSWSASPTWYQWIVNAYESYDNKWTDTAVAAFGLSNTNMINAISNVTTVPDEPFFFPVAPLFSGFAPRASMWIDFIDFATCAYSNPRTTLTSANLSVSSSDPYSLLSSSVGGGSAIEWWNQLETNWIYFTKHTHRSNLYQFDAQGKPLMQLLSSDSSADNKIEVRKADKNAEIGEAARIPSTKFILTQDNTKLTISLSRTKRLPVKRFLLMSAAVGYPLGSFQRYVGTLRKFFHGDVWLSTSNNVSTEIEQYMTRHNIHWMVQPELTGHKAKDRFSFFETVCDADKYTLCLHTDFRDSFFQGDPFAEFYESADDEKNSILYVYNHNKLMNRWAYKQYGRCGLRKYEKYIRGKLIPNAGSIIASPSIWKELARINLLFNDCDDQILYLAWIYTPEIRNETVTPRPIIKHHTQGEGAMNVVGFGGIGMKDGHNRWLNRNCLVSPVLHQPDRKVDWTSTRGIII